MTTFTGTAGIDDLSSSTLGAIAGDVILGLAGDDTLSATVAGITLDGGSGNDQLFSTGGNTLIGGSGDDFMLSTGTNDTVSYASDPAGVTVDLLNGFAFDGTGGTDTLLGIANVTGSAFDDTLIGDDFANVLQGGAGDDTLTGNGGADVFKFNFTQGGGETFSFTEFFAEHGGTVTADGEVADGTKQGQFSSLYTQWLESLGMTVLDLGQNSGPDGMPVVEVIEGADGTFGERESFTWTSGSVKKTVTHERWYSDTWTSGDGGDAVTSNDGFDTIVDFTFGEDKLEFNGLGSLTLAEFTSFFDVTVVDADNDGITDDTQLALLNDSWSVSLLDDNGAHVLSDFHANIFS